jgi:hypothetical protein
MNINNELQSTLHQRTVSQTMQHTDALATINRIEESLNLKAKNIIVYHRLQS